MAFTKTTWYENTPITPAQLNRIETGVGDAHDDTALLKASFYSVAFTRDGIQKRLPGAGWTLTRMETGVFRIGHPLGTDQLGVVATWARGGLLLPVGDSEPRWVYVRSVTSTYIELWTMRASGPQDLDVNAIVFPFA
jgi:hypothetical protein